MRTVKYIKPLLNTIAAIALAGCGGSPSVSVLPSTDSFEQQGNEVTAKMDILWVVDNSLSMEDFQLAIEAQFLAFMNNFQDKGYDFQMAITATDAWVDLDYTDYVANGKPAFGTSHYSRFKAANDGVTRILTSETPDIVEKFREMVLVGTGGTGDERALQSIEAARLNPDNASFFRSDAHLAIIIVSDEDDSSWRQRSYVGDLSTCSLPGKRDVYVKNTVDLNNDGDTDDTDETAGYMYENCIPDVQDVAYYKNFLDQNSSATLGATVHNMAIEEGNEACRTADANYNRYFGIRTSSLANSTGGTISTLCGDFAESLDNIAKVIIETTVEFKLTETPADPSLLQVSVKVPGASDFSIIPQSQENGWVYNEIKNSILFYGEAIPVQGSEVKILYDPDSL